MLDQGTASWTTVSYLHRIFIGEKKANGWLLYSSLHLPYVHLKPLLIVLSLLGCLRSAAMGRGRICAASFIWNIVVSRRHVELSLLIH